MSITSKVNKDSSRVYTVNNQEVIVTKAQLDEVAKVMKDNNIKELKVGDIKLGRGSALPAWVVGISSFVIYTLKVTELWWASKQITYKCAMAIDGCARMVIGLYNGAKWAHDQARNWAHSR